MTWRDKFVENLAAGCFGGITMGRWARLLIDNRFDVSPSFLPRAVATTALTPFNSMMKRYEELRFGRKIQATQVPPPLFVLGHWRSGTTHLQNLLAVDDRFATPNLYQVFFPHTFLTTESLNSRFVEFFVPRRRGFDNVHQHVLMPHEDEIAHCTMSGLTSYLSMAFPRRSEYYDRFLTFRRADENETSRWRSDLEWFLKKLTLKHKKPLILKSPPHTCRIGLLLKMFPDAKFIHIHRNPFAVFQSMIRLVEWSLKLTGLQRFNVHDCTERIFRNYREMHDLFFEERSLIPNGHFCEVAFAALHENPIEELEWIYRTFDLPDFQHCQRDMREYLQSISGYKRNEFTDLPSELRKTISERWQPSFDEWGYRAV